MLGLTNPFRLRRRGVLGMNRRNHAYVLACNPRQYYPRVDDKLLTKQLAAKAGLAVPKLLAVVRWQHQIKQLPRLLADRREFVIKPAEGSGGRGIVVICDRGPDGQYIKTNGQSLTDADLYRDVSNTLSGLYSLGGRIDCAMIEQRIHADEAFADYSYQGVPDVRIVVFRGYPVMAMMRCSTAASDGKANLHQGAIGVGISLRTGESLLAVQHNRPIDRHPDTGKTFDHITIPRWDEHLLLAARCFEITHMGFFGADIVLDRDLGPMILELNARPGLSIQIANGRGLLPRLRAVEALEPEPMPGPLWRVQFAKENFQ